jgi:hypothetical protein
MPALVSLALLAFAFSGQGDLVFIESDIRQVRGRPWMEGMQLLHIEAGCFLALSGESPPSGVVWWVVDRAPVDPESYRILHQAQCGGVLPPLPGEVALLTGDFALIRLPEPETGPVSIPGIGILRPLRVHREPGFASPPEFLRGDSVLVDMIVSAVNQDSIISGISHMEGYGTRYMFSPEYAACADWADTRMASFGISSEQQPFVYQGVQMSNVVGEITGSENPDRIYIICAHLDSYSSNPLMAPGADDNASGSAAVLEAARVMSSFSFRNTVRFVLFAAEEAWMIGSTHYVQSAHQQGDNILGAVNLDMILYAPHPSDSVYIPFNEQSEPLAIAAGEAFERYSPSIHPRVVYDPGAPSDQAPFWEYGYVATAVMEASVTEIWGGYNPHYHQPSDLLANYLASFPYGTDAARAAIGLVASLADPTGFLSIEEGGGLSPDRISVFPNPCRTGTISIVAEGDSPGRNRLFILDLAGRVVASGNTDGSGEFRLDAGSLPVGVYSVVCPGSNAAPERFVRIR